VKYTAAFAAALACVFVVGCNSAGPAQADAQQNNPETKEAEINRAELEELLTEDVTVGDGAEAADGDLVAVKYKGTLKDGSVFDTNDRPDAPPFAFVVGNRQVIPGWDQGVKGMRKGGTRKLSIPAELGYGSRGAGDSIPPNTDLYFEVELLDVVKKGEEHIYDDADVKVGSGPAAKRGDKVTIHYTGTLVNGKKFDSSHDRNQPFTFTLGANEVVPGFDAGVQGMKQGGVRKLRIPPELAYGNMGQGNSIPPNSILVFEIELLKIN
jgi:FKBP-type peptidyl-prolyl cis-trans isomerase